MSLKVLEAQPTDMEMSMFAQLTAIKGKQFGRDVYSSMIKFKDLDKFLASFPEVQRQINVRKVASIRRYILSGLEKSETERRMRFFSSMTVTCRGHILYSEHNHRIALNTNEVKLSINDGQHRAEAINQAIDYLEKEFVKSKDKLKTARIRSYIDELSEMVIPVVIYDGLSEREEKMLFHDLNNLAQRPSKNANIRLNQTDLFSRMARELSHSNKYLKHYGVEEDKSSIQEGNDNTILLATVYQMVKELLGNELNHDRDFLNENNYDEFKKDVEETLDRLFFILPPDLDAKGKYLTEKSYTLKSITRFINHARHHLDLRLSDDKIFEVIADMDWTMNLDFWEKYGGTAGIKDGNIVFAGGGHGAAKSVYRALIDRATGE
jgi:DNA sulfur modification protein DndB